MNYYREHWSYLTESGRYPGIDWLRALAVLLVLLYHFQFFRAGWVGVDMFFTISGFLIGGIIMDALAKRSFSFKEFYVRRMLRILPIYYFTILLCALFKADAEGSMSNAAASIASSLLFLQTTGPFFWPNIFSIDMGYVPGGSWSLVVEEMFYLIAPAFLMVLMKVARGGYGWIAGMAGLIMISGILSRLHFTKMYAPGDANLFMANFIQFHSRYDELAAGIAAAAIVRWRFGKAEFTSWMFAAGLFFSWLFFAYLYGKPGYLNHPNEISGDSIWLPTLMGLACTSLLLACYRWPLRCVPVIVLARLSYPLYLIHIFYIEVTSPLQGAGFLAWLTRTFSFEGRAVISVFICVVLAYFASLLVEYPFIRLYKKGPTAVASQSPVVAG